jgi:hypothetical protein
MTGPRPAGRPWALTDDDMLRKLLASGMKAAAIALKMTAPSVPFNRGRAS